MSNLLLPILSPPGRGMDPFPKRDNIGPTSMIEPRSCFASFLYCEEFRKSILTLSALNSYLPLDRQLTLTPRPFRRFNNLFTSTIFGILEIVIFSLVSNTAHKI